MWTQLRNYIETCAWTLVRCRLDGAPVKFVDRRRTAVATAFTKLTDERITKVQGTDHGASSRWALRASVFVRKPSTTCDAHTYVSVTKAVLCACCADLLVAHSVTRTLIHVHMAVAHVEAVLTTHRKAITKVFRHYSERDGAKTKSSKPSDISYRWTMYWPQFHLLLQQCGIIAGTSFHDSFGGLGGSREDAYMWNVYSCLSPEMQCSTDCFSKVPLCNLAF